MVQSIITSINGSSVFLPSPPQPSSSKSRRRKLGFRHRCNRYPTTAKGKDLSGGNGRGRLVDENMIVLRKRIQEMKMVERNDEAPENWMEWEKRYYTDYDSDVYEAVGLLQTQLMETRPSVTLGMVALLTLSVPTSTFMVALQLMEMAKGILSEIHFL